MLRNSSCERLAILLIPVILKFDGMLLAAAPLFFLMKESLKLFFIFAESSSS